MLKRSYTFFEPSFRSVNVGCLLAVFFLLLMQASTVFAATATGERYQSSIQVENQSPDERSRGMKLGLEQVLVRISGRSDAAREPEVRRALGVASRYVQSYTYQQALEGLSLQLKYDPQLVQNLLRQAGLPMWVSGRPTVLLWLSVQQEGQAELVTPRSKPAISRQVEQEMARRGIPIKWPAATAIRTDDVRRLRTDKIREASSRYAEQASFAASVELSAAEDAASDELLWRGRCLYLSASDEAAIRCQSGSSGQFLASAVDSLADIIAGQFSVQIAGGESSSVRLEVAGINNFRAYGRTLQHLKSNALVRNTQIVYVSGDSVMFELELQGSQQQLQDSLSSQRVLQAVDVEPGASNLRYRVGRGGF